MRIVQDLKLGFDDVLIRPKRSNLPSRNDADLLRSLKCPHGGMEISGVPVVAANMDTVATVALASALRGKRLFTAMTKFIDPMVYTSLVDSWEYPNGHEGGLFYTLGPRESENVSEALSRTSRGLVCLDSPNGYTEPFADLVKRVRECLPDSFILAGNVATPEMTEALILAGASCVKVGIGGGAACTTRVMTGVGYPQLSAIIECADAAHGLRGHICSDGGCRTPGDVAKAFCAGADLVMLGGMFAGTAETLRGSDAVATADWGANGDTVSFRGMSSADAMKDHYKGISSYRASEGKSVKIPYKGDVSDVVLQILGGLRGACALIGAEKIKDMPKCATFVLVREQENRVFGSDFKWWER